MHWLLRFALIINSTSLLAQPIHLDKLFLLNEAKQITQTVITRFPEYRKQGNRYIFQKYKFAYLEDEKRDRYEITAYPTPIFKINDISLLDTIRLAHVDIFKAYFGTNPSYKVLPSTNGGYEVIFAYQTKDLVKVKMFFASPVKQEKNPLIDYSDDWVFYKNAHLIRISVSKLPLPSKVTEENALIMRLKQKGDSLVKKGQLSDALAYYQQLDRKYDTERSGYSSVCSEIRKISHELGNYPLEIKAIQKEIKNDFYGEASYGYNIRRLAELYLFTNEKQKLYQLDKTVLNSYNTSWQEKFSVTLYAHIARYISGDNDQKIKDMLLDALVRTNWRFPKVWFGELVEWLQRPGIKTHQKVYILSLIDRASTRKA